MTDKGIEQLTTSTIQFKLVWNALKENILIVVTFNGLIKQVI